MNNPLNAYRVTVMETVDSTNEAAMALGERGEPEGAVIIAGEQTAGRGRNGHAFYSPADTGLYMSILLRPKGPGAQTVALTAMAAVAVARAIEKVSLRQALIKWVNDIYCDRKKVCGILAESAFTGNRMDYAVVGIGVNVYPPKGGFPPQASPAGAVFSETVADRTSVSDRTSVADRASVADMRAKMAEAILEEFGALIPGSPEVLEEYRRRSLVIGRSVWVPFANGDREALALSVEDDFSLRVRFSDGREKVLRSGEVSIRL